MEETNEELVIELAKEICVEMKKTIDPHTAIIITIEGVKVVKDHLFLPFSKDMLD